ncbi:ABC transporter ATP-binding protein [Tahibacter sp.]|uniref:ABC transporter ATP-binding protein n=1 Tax=Tahibacter sp. TaxID=2056211 RepID=UPI0028C3BAB1|nr:ABC transporter ATP-binding protein [Tahibacter sp.]
MIAVKGLRFSYSRKSKQKGDAPTLKGLDFEVQSGEIFGFLGPSGSGKSTTQKLLTGILAGYDGSIVVKGRELSAWDNSYYREIGVGFEMPNHFPKLTALENLKLFAAFYDGNTLDPMTLLEQLGLAADANKQVGAFSKGMKMRLNFARAIMHRPGIVFLDEPTAGLDPMNARTMKQIIKTLKAQGCTVFLTTHNMLDAEELCDRIAFIVDGQLATIGNLAQMKRTFGEPSVVVEYRTGGESESLQKAAFGLQTLAEDADFQRILATAKLWSIHSQEASVEEIFFKATGTKLA